MSTPAQMQTKAKPAAKAASVTNHAQSGLVLRKCACGESAGVDGECSECREKKLTVQRRAIHGAQPPAVPSSTGQPSNPGSSVQKGAGAGHNISRIRVSLAVPGRMQAKLTVNEPGDKYEHEADRVAEQVMRMAAPEDSQEGESADQAHNFHIKQLPSNGVNIHRQEETEEAESEDEEPLQAKEAVGQQPEVTPELQARIDSIRDGGQSLPESTRAFMESRFGYDFSQVRIHTDAQAAETAQAVKAKAYTLGRDIVFGDGQYAPGTTAGKELLAHELAHVVQQNEVAHEGLQRQAQTDSSSGTTEELQRELERLQKEQGPKRDEARIEKLKKRIAERGTPTTSDCPISLEFDGIQLTVSGEKNQSFPAVSGKPVDGTFDYSPERQKIEATGPIPEGIYWINPSQLKSLWYYMGSAAAAWGSHRITIHPFDTTHTFGRGGFFIHGGSEPGSAGCIDLTSHMSAFAEIIKKYGDKDCKIILQVKYPKLRGGTSQPQESEQLQRRIVDSGTPSTLSTLSTLLSHSDSKEDIHRKDSTTNTKGQADTAKVDIPKIIDEVATIVNPIVEAVKEDEEFYKTWQAVRQQIKSQIKNPKSKVPAHKEKYAGLYKPDLVNVFKVLRELNDKQNKQIKKKKSRKTDEILNKVLDEIGRKLVHARAEGTKINYEEEFKELDGFVQRYIDGGLEAYVSIRCALFETFGSLQRANDFYKKIDTAKAKFLGHPVTVHPVMKKKLEKAEGLLTKTRWKEVAKASINTIGGFNIRKNRNSDTLSEHSFGWAIDINEDINPNIRDFPVSLVKALTGVDFTGEDVKKGESKRTLKMAGEGQLKTEEHIEEKTLLPAAKELRQSSEVFKKIAQEIFKDEKSLKSGLINYLKSQGVEVSENKFDELFELAHQAYEEKIIEDEERKKQKKQGESKDLFRYRKALTSWISGARAQPKEKVPRETDNFLANFMMEAYQMFVDTRREKIEMGAIATGHPGQLAVYGYIDLAPELIAALVSPNGGGLRWLGTADGTRDFMHFDVHPMPEKELNKDVAAPLAPGCKKVEPRQKKTKGKAGKKPVIQEKLIINQPGDKYEQEADQVAEHIMRMPAPEISQAVEVSGQAKSLPIQQRLSSEEEKIHRQEGVKVTEDDDREEPLQAKEDISQPSKVTPELQTRIDSIRGGGEPLSESARAFMEPRFGYNFHHVRIHADAQAAETARVVNAKAYTMGRDIVFGNGQYAPGTTAGKELLAHELTHVVQQEGLSRLNSIQSMQRQPVPAKVHTPWDDLPTNARQTIDKTYFNDELRSESQSAFRAVYTALMSEGLWDEVVHVVNVYPQNVRGIEAIAKTSLSGRLLSHPHLCRDSRLGGSQHSGAVMWRQLVQAGTEGLHVGVSSSGRMVAHLDTLAPVDGRETNGECHYSMPHVLPHVQKDLKGMRNLEFFPAPTSEPKPGEMQPDVRISIPGT